ncbi:MAG TPA: polyprenyl synthetase family protein, partial [Acidimicrobiales bacterium]|nr:polyprenyl synthetase family protein [Acidimicrobiales bacterium]
WSVPQIERLAALAPDPVAWLDDEVGRAPAAGPGRAAVVDDALDRPAGIAVVPPAPHPPGPAVGSRPAVGDPVEAVRGAVDRVLEGFLAARDGEAADLHPAVGQVTGEVRRLVAAGGKRLRPAFAYWGHRATGSPHDEGVVQVAAALELLHTFALLHDDVMDRSDHRRGQPTAQRSLAATHRADALVGDDAWFGVSGAVLAGDLAFLWATSLLDEAPLASDARARARAVFTRLCSEVIAGQYLDLRLAHGDGDGGGAGEELAGLVALLKSARYTVTRPLQVGAALAPASPPGGDPALEAALASYGDAVGTAFQLRDDVLGLFGDPDETGKSCVDDLREGKRTLLVVRALRLAPERDRRVLVASLGDPELDEADADRCRRIVAASGAWASVEALVAARESRALRALRRVPEPARTALSTLAGLASQRRR